MANDLPVGTSVEATDAYGQKLAGFVTKAPAENNNKYQVQVRQKWDFLPEGGEGWVAVAVTAPADFAVEKVKQSEASRKATWAQ